MFLLDFTAEDTRLIARESKTMPNSMDLLLLAGSGESHEIHGVAFCDLEKIVSGMICCHGDIPAEAYPHLEEILKDCPLSCRPIP